MSPLPDDRRPGPPSLRTRDANRGTRDASRRTRRASRCTGDANRGTDRAGRTDRAPGVLAAAVLMAAAMVLAPALPAPTLALTTTASPTTADASTTGTTGTTGSPTDAATATTSAAATTATATPRTRTGPETYAEQLIATAQDSLRRDPATIGSDQAPVTELVWAADLADLARGAADRMAAAGTLSHDPAVGATLCCGAAYGDNIGYWSASRTDIARLRSAAQRLVAAWAASDGHRDNLLDVRFTHVGVGGHLDDQGRLWAAVVFQDRRAGIGGLATSAPRPRGLDTACPGEPATTTSARFTDVEGRHAHAIDCLAARGVITGVTADRFDPAGTLTRGQLAMLLDRTLTEVAADLPPRLAGAFTDVPGTSTAGPAIERLAAAGIVTGRPDGEFRPGVEVTRGQLAAQLDAAVRALAGEAPTPARGYFTDVGPALRFSRAIDVTAELGLMAGDESGRFRPDAPLRRDHAATVIARLLDHLES